MEGEKEVPKWFYYASIVSAFLFTIYISIYSAIHFESIRYMNVVVVFLFISIISFFLISAVYFHTDRIGHHVLAPVIFFIGMASLVIYAYNAVDASDVVRYSMMYTLAVMGISLLALLPKKRATLPPASKKWRKNPEARIKIKNGKHH